MTTQELYALLKILNLRGLKQGNHNYLACCPSHDERRPSWGISVNPPHLHGCFSCGYKGTLRTLLLDQGWSLTKVNNLLGSAPVHEGLAWIFLQGATKRANLLKPVEERILWPFVEDSPIVFDYLKSRGIKEATCRKAGLLYDRKQNRVVFPWRWNARLLGATGRSLVDREGVPKIVAYSLEKGHALYLPAKTLKPTEVILVEGEIDALAVYQAGYRNVAALGHGRFTQQQEALLVNLPVNRVTLFFDNDRRGKELTKEVASRMRNHCRVLEVPWHGFSKKDPAELKRTEIQRMILRAVEGVDWSAFTS